MGPPKGPGQKGLAREAVILDYEIWTVEVASFPKTALRAL